MRRWTLSPDGGIASTPTPHPASLDSTMPLPRTRAASSVGTRTRTGLAAQVPARRTAHALLSGSARAQRLLADALDSVTMEAFVVGCIFCLAVLMLVDIMHANPFPPNIDWILHVADTVIMGVFVAEVTLKTAAFGTRYVYVVSNALDGTLVISSFVLQLLALGERPVSSAGVDDNGDGVALGNAMEVMQPKTQHRSAYWRPVFRASSVLVVGVRLHRVHRLWREQHDIWRFKRQAKRSIQTPAERVLQVLRAVRRKYALDEADDSDMEWAARAVGNETSALFRPVLDRQSSALKGDKETKKWIMSNFSPTVTKAEGLGERRSEAETDDEADGEQGHGTFEDDDGLPVVRPRRHTVLMRPRSLSATRTGRQSFGGGEGPATSTITTTLEQRVGAECVEDDRAGRPSHHEMISASSTLSYVVPASTELKNAEARIGEASFAVDAFELEALANGRALLVAALCLFQKLNVVTSFSLDLQAVQSFFCEVNDGYDRSNSFHNATHAADVLLTSAAFMRVERVASMLSNTDIFAALVAAAVHDYRHTGTNNAFHVATQSELAVRYNDRAILESFHLASAFAVAKQQRCNIFAALQQELFVELRESIVQAVLATDMAQHFGELAQFKARALDANGNGEAMTGLDHQKLDDRRLVLKTLLHCADVSNPVKNLRVALRWSKCVTDEFFAQGDRERELGLPISPFMDRTKPAIEKCQVGFINFIVAPLFDAWTDFLGSHSLAREIKRNIGSNLMYWESKKQEHDTLDQQGVTIVGSDAINALFVAPAIDTDSIGLAVSAEV